MRDDFHELNTELIGLSIDSNNSHLAWIKEIQDNIRFGKYDGQPVDFPIIADIKAEVARKYGMVHPSMSDTKAVRAVFIIDDEGYIRTILYYPQTTGRNQTGNRSPAGNRPLRRFHPGRLAAGKRHSARLSVGIKRHERTDQ